jgi:hypothetical protein
MSAVIQHIELLIHRYRPVTQDSEYIYGFCNPGVSSRELLMQITFH